MAHQPAWQNPGIVTREMFAARMQRWFQLRLTMMPLPALIEPMFECFPSMLIMSWALSHYFGNSINIYIFAIIHCLTWITCDAFTMHFIAHSYPNENVHRHPASTSCTSFLRLWLEQELTSIPNRINALRQPTVNWRGRMFQLQWGGTVTEMKSTSVTPVSFCGNGDKSVESQCNRRFLSDLDLVNGDVLNSSPSKNGLSDGMAR
jgi:hypothetical protein